MTMTSFAPASASAAGAALTLLSQADIYRLAQVAGRLEMSIDWLLGRSDVMQLPPREKGKRAYGR
jgi:hypothetical protein